jgi:hypothetical protein
LRTLVLHKVFECFTSCIAKVFEIERARGDAVMLFEAARKIGGGGETAIQGDICQRQLRRVRHRVQRALKPLPLDELIERFAEKRFENAMEMKPREARGFSDVVQVQRASEVRHDVIDGPVHALDVLRRVIGRFCSLFVLRHVFLFCLLVEAVRSYLVSFSRRREPRPSTNVATLFKRWKYGKCPRLGPGLRGDDRVGKDSLYAREACASDTVGVCAWQDSSTSQDLTSRVRASRAYLRLGKFDFAAQSGATNIGG